MTNTPCLPQRGTQDKSAFCECTKIDARVCLPCNCQFCHSCVKKNLPPDCPTRTSCSKCNDDVDCHKCNSDCPTRKPDPCEDNSRVRTDYTNYFFCYNCIKEKRSQCRVQTKKFCLDCGVPLLQNYLKQHKTFIKKKQHTTLPVSLYMLAKKFEIKRCKIHPKHALLFVCTKCDVILCQICVACFICEKNGGRHDTHKLDVAAMEMTVNINQSIKDIDCVCQSGEKAITEAQ